MKRKHMLPYPFMDMEVTADDVRRLLADVEARGPGMTTIHDVMAHLIQRTLIGMAGMAHGKKAAADGDFQAGAALIGHDWAKRALQKIESDLLVPMLNLEGEDDVIFEEITAFGRRALVRGEME